MALGQQQNARCLGVQAMDEAQVFQTPRARPEIAGGNGGNQRRLQENGISIQSRGLSMARTERSS